MIEVLLRPGDSGDLVNQVIASLNRIGLREQYFQNAAVYGEFYKTLHTLLKH